MDIKKSPEESKSLINTTTRKRKQINDDQDSENLCPAAKKQCSPSHLVGYSSDTQSSSECYSTTADIYDITQLGSPPASVNNIFSPVVEDTLPKTWMPKGDKTPHANKKLSWNKLHKGTTCFITPTADLRLCPLPAMSWAESQDVWRLMCRKDAKASLDRTPLMLQYHPGLQPRMRAILLDWLIEVCEVYKLHRETYYLAVDYLDRFLTAARTKVNKAHLQLIGITCLFIAAKVEEIYPPKIGEFAYVTDSACTEEDITNQELIILKALNWSISTITIMGWLSVYMQVNVTSRPPPLLQHTTATKSSTSTTTNTDKIPNLYKNNSDSFVYPQFSGMEFVHTAQLVDLCTLDIDLANYPYSVVAAAAMSHTFDKKTAVTVSGLEWGEIKSCAEWMEPFFKVICDECPQLFLLETNEQIKTEYGLKHICPNITTDESHILQTHSISLVMFDKVTLLKDEANVHAENSPAVELKCPEGLLTPPASSRKPSDIEL